MPAPIDSFCFRTVLSLTLTLAACDSGSSGGASGAAGGPDGRGGTTAGSGSANGGGAGLASSGGGGASGVGAMPGATGGEMGAGLAGSDGRGGGPAAAGSDGGGGDGGRAADGGPPPSFAGPTTLGTVTVTRATVTGRVGPRFVGLSFEKTHMSDGFFAVGHAPLIALLKLLGPGSLRIGANDVDASVWMPTATTVAPGTTSPNVGTVEVDALSDFLAATGWQAIYGVNMKTSTPAAAVAEARYVATRLGNQLAALEIGNEINFFGDYATIGPMWEKFATAILAEVSGLPLAGPASGADPSFDVPFAHDQASRLVQLTHHYYRGAAGSSTATMAALLAPDPNATTQGRTVSTAATDNHIRDGWRWGEMNSFSGHGQAGVSDAYGAALWSIDFMLTSAQLPACAGVNFHGGGQNQDGNPCPNGPASCTRPFRYSPIVEVDSRVTGAAPLFYGLLLVSQAGTGNLLDTRVAAGTLAVTAYAIAQSDGSTNVVLINKDAVTGADAQVDVGVAVSSATAQFLRGPSLTAVTGVTFGEAAITATGAWTPHAPYELPTAGKVISVVVPPATAVLVRAR